MESTVEFVYQNSINYPKKKAIITIDGEISYGELWNKIIGVADLLKSHGVKKGDHVLLEASHTVEYVTCFLAIHLLSAVHVTLEHGAPKNVAENIARETECTLMLLGNSPLKSLNVSFDTVVGNDCGNYDFPRGDMIQEIMFTTGTTGKSKGVVLTFEASLCRCLYQIEAMNMPKDMVWLIPSPMNHAAALRRTLVSLTNGTTSVLIDGISDLKLFFECVEKYNVNSLYLPPSAIHYILTLASKKLAKFDKQIKSIFSSSSVLSATDKNLLNKVLPYTKKYDGYGSSESGPSAFVEYGFTEPIAGCVGKPLPGYEIFIVDNDYVPIKSNKDNPGIVAIRSRGLACGYWNEPELTKNTFLNGVIYMTDMGYFENNNLILVGRRDDIINIGGLKVSPYEVEEIARKFPSVNECVCMGYDDKILGKTVKLFVSEKNGCSVDIHELLNFMEEYLESHKIPKRIEIISEIPKTYNGKTDRKQLLNKTESVLTV